MSDSKLIWFAGRMKRVGEDHQSVYQFRLTAGQDRGLPPAVRHPAHEYWARNHLFQDIHCTAQASLVLGSSSSWRSMGMALAIGKITTQAGDTSLCERLRQGN